MKINFFLIKFKMLMNWFKSEIDYKIWWEIKRFLVVGLTIFTLKDS
jgi:hypothetical protein